MGMEWAVGVEDSAISGEWIDKSGRPLRARLGGGGGDKGRTRMKLLRWSCEEGVLIFLFRVASFFVPSKGPLVGGRKVICLKL
jgi:hypothetical protein